MEEDTRGSTAQTQEARVDGDGDMHDTVHVSSQPRPERARAHHSQACQSCRAKKTKCDTKKPVCASCVVHQRQCVYAKGSARPRPSTAIINSIQDEKRALEKLLMNLKEAAPEGRSELLNQFTTVNGEVQLVGERRSRPNALQTTDRDNAEQQSSLTSRDPSKSLGVSDNECSVDLAVNATQFLSVDECGQVGVFGPSSALHSPVKGPLLTVLPTHDVRNQLVANAALQRQREFSLRSLPDIDGVPTELAMHLLDLHWNRSHHAFLLTYRPAFTRDLISGGPYTSTFLLNAVFASASKYSSRPELRDDPFDPRTSGARFFRRCAEILMRDSLFERSSIPSIVGLLLLGSAFLARGELSKSWLYTGLALRMVYDLGLHLDCRQPGCDAEDLEIRRRVFWGAFICDKLQSLYLGRPFAIPLRDALVTTDFMDTMEELDPWTPYVDAICPNTNCSPCEPTLVHSVTTFQQFCLLSKLMTEIIQSFYFVGANASNAQAKLESLDKGLSSWYRKLSSQLVFQPWSEDSALSDKRVSPNIIILNTTYHSLVILLHRPFMSEGHLRSLCPPADSWKKCTLAAKHITSIMKAYRSAYALRGAPYLASYASYVACTIHVREAALQNGRGASTCASFEMLEETLSMLDELSVASPWISGPAKIIRGLMEANRVYDRIPSLPPDTNSSPSFDIEAIARLFPVPAGPGNNTSQPGVTAGTSDMSRVVSDNTMVDSMMNDSLFGFMDVFDPQYMPVGGGRGIEFENFRTAF